MKIKHMIVILFILLSAVPLTFLGMTNMNYYNRRMQSVLENDQKIAISTQVKAIENFYEERRTDAAVILGYRVVDLLLNTEWDPASTQQLRNYIEDLLRSRTQSNRFVESITILDQDFRVAACSDASARDKISELKFMDPKYLTPQMRFTHVIASNRDNTTRRVLAAVQQIIDGGEICGYLVEELNLSFFEEVRQSASLFNNGTIYILDGKGQLVTAGDSSDSREEFVLSEDEQSDFQRAWSTRDENSTSGVLKYRARGDHYLSCYARINGMDWIIISSVNMDEVLRTREGFYRLFLLIASVLVILMVLVQAFFRHNISDPVKEMIDRFRQIRENQDYSIRMDQTERNEIGIICEQVNSLLAGIENYIRTQKLEQERLKTRAERDPLTGLFNKASIEQILRMELERAQVEQSPILCLFLDVDNFKQFNTLHGHIGGDRVLSFIAQTLAEAARGPAARVGGDEFVACLGELSRGEAHSILEDLLARINRGVVLEEGGDRVKVCCSIGAVFSDDVSTYEQLIARADEAMYDIKRQNKNGYRIWTRRERA